MEPNDYDWIDEPIGNAVEHGDHYVEFRRQVPEPRPRRVKVILGCLRVAYRPDDADGWSNGDDTELALDTRRMAINDIEQEDDERNPHRWKPWEITLMIVCLLILTSAVGFYIHLVILASQ